VTVMTPKRHVSLHFRVRPLLLRFIVSAVCLALTVILVPNVYFSGDYRVLTWFGISAMFGLLMAFVKPLLQLILLPLIFVSYGLVIVFINTIIILLLTLFFPARFHVEHFLWALAAGLVSGLLITLLENVFGLSPPIIQGGTEQLRERMKRATSGHVEKELLEAAETGKHKIRKISKPEDESQGEEGS
jgi:putative membrane protein